MTRILYIFDRQGWALENVGRLWAALLADSHQFDLCAFGAHRKLRPDEYSYVLFGCTLTIERHLRIKRILSGLGLLRHDWLPWQSSNFISVVHDPCELFPQIAEWKQASPQLFRLAHFRRVAVISNEMQNIMGCYGFSCVKINTTSSLPVRAPDQVVAEPLAILSRANPIPRKNLGLFHRLQDHLSASTARFDGYFDQTILPRDEYAQLLDRYNCYICTSWQEGGPLPLFDAIHRGCAVLTTPVGQTDEWVEHGRNGFFCVTENDFRERIQWLAANPQELLAFRRRSLQIAQSDRSTAIRHQLRAFLS